MFYSQKLLKKKGQALGLGGGGLCQNQGLSESQAPGQKYPSQSGGALPWGFPTVKSVQTDLDPLQWQFIET